MKTTTYIIQSTVRGQKINWKDEANPYPTQADGVRALETFAAANLRLKFRLVRRTTTISDRLIRIKP